MARRWPRCGWITDGAALLVIIAAVSACTSLPGGGPSASPTGSGLDATGTPQATGTPTAQPEPSGTPPSTTQRTIAQLLALLSIRAEQRAGYDDSLFPRWTDADGDGCNTRREVLIAESLTPVTVGSGCDLRGGTWFSVYDGATATDPAEISIDHVVALAEAWDSGASGWSSETRERFANDLGVAWALIAVTPSSNSEKSDRDPADWLPSRAEARCDYLADWAATKVRWGLAVDQREHDAILRAAAGCTATRPVVLALDGGSGLPGTPAPTVAPTGGSGQCDPAYPTVCIPPPPPDLDCGDITFRRFAVLAPDPHRFDGDGDGVGCEG